MLLNIHGGEFLTGSLDVISQSLSIPILECSEKAKFFKKSNTFLKN